MKAYVITTGTVFGLIVVAHVWRVIAEGPAVAKNPFYILMTGAALALTVWAWRVFRERPAPGKDTVIVTHYPNIAAAYAQEANGLAEGEALILHPDGRGGAPIVARVKIDEWASLARQAYGSTRRRTPRPALPQKSPAGRPVIWHPRIRAPDAGHVGEQVPVRHVCTHQLYFQVTPDVLPGSGW